MLVLRGIHRSFRRRPVLRGADLNLAPGLVQWLGGPNGAGKTTLLRVAAGLLAPDAGEISVDGISLAGQRRSYASRIAYLAAGDRGLYARLTVHQQLQLQAALAFLPVSERDDSVERALARYGLAPMAGQRVDRLSMGQRQRVRLAVALLHEPPVVLLDEPHTSLDDAGLELLGRAMDDVTARGGTVLWCSPDGGVPPLRRDADHLLIEGRVVAA